MFLSHPCHRGAGVHMDKPPGGTSELTVYLHVHRLTSGLKCKGARIMAVTGQEADERVGDARESDDFLRLSGRE